MINLRLQCLVAALFFVTLRQSLEVTPVRKNQKNFGFLLTYS